MNEQQIQQLKDALREFIEAILQSGQPIDAQLESMIVQAMEHVATRIQQLRTTETPADGLPSGISAQGQQVPTADHPSSNIYGFNYDPKSGNMLVKFMGKDSAGSGPTYQYAGVEPHVFDIIKRGAIAPRTSGKNKYHQWFRGQTPSHGASVYALLKAGGYNYQRMG